MTSATLWQSCGKSKKPDIHREAPMQEIASSAPLELIGIDFLHLDQRSARYQCLLVTEDPFTRFTQAYPTTNKSSNTAGDLLCNAFIMCYSFPDQFE